MRGWNRWASKLKAAQEQEADFLRQKRALDDERRELKLQMERQVQQELETRAASGEISGKGADGAAGAGQG